MTNPEKSCAAAIAALLGVAGLVAASLAAYAALYLAVGGPFKPEGPMWTLCVLWVTSHVGGYISAVVSAAFCVLGVHLYLRIKPGKLGMQPDEKPTMELPAISQRSY